MGFLAGVVAVDDGRDLCDEFIGIAEAGQDALGDFAALEFVFKADVGFAPVAAEAFGDDALRAIIFFQV